MSGTTSRNKGKAGERDAANYLQEIGFPDARRRVQASGFAAGEVECIDTLPNIHFEIKAGYKKGLGVGMQLLSQACAQAFGDCHNREWCVLWREHGCRIWKLTCASANGIGNATVAGDETIADTLRWLNEGTAAKYERTYP